MEDSNCIYNGPVLNNKKHGHGFYSSDNETYVGLWKEDKKHGHGVHTLIHKFVYVGNWKDNMKDGMGKITYENGNTYEGEWQNDEPYGFGKITDSNGSIYKGEIKNNTKDGYGVIIDMNTNIRYEGYFKNNKKDGTGKIIYPDNHIYKYYEGTWNNGIRDNEGKVTYKDESIYEGEFKIIDNLQHQYIRDGRGTYNNNGIKNNGIWKDDKIIKQESPRNYQDNSKKRKEKSSTNIESNTNSNKSQKKSKNYIKYDERLGDIYSVEYKNGLYEGQLNESELPDGEGYYKYNNNLIYNGKWKHGKKNGDGEIMYNGNSFMATWNNGNPDNITCEYNFSNNDRYEGEVIVSNSHDKKILFYKTMDGKEVHGIIHGKGKYIYANGDVYEGNFVNGLKNGEGNFYDKDGITICEGIWQDDNIFEEDESKRGKDNKKSIFDHVLLQGLEHIADKEIVQVEHNKINLEDNNIISKEQYEANKDMFVACKHVNGEYKLYRICTKSEASKFSNYYMNSVNTEKTNKHISINELYWFNKNTYDQLLSLNNSKDDNWGSPISNYSNSSFNRSLKRKALE